MSMMDIDHQGPNGSSGDSQPVTGIIYPPPDIRSMYTLFYYCRIQNTLTNVYLFFKKKR